MPEKKKKGLLQRGKEFLVGKDPEIKQVPNFTKAQRDYLNKFLSQAGGILGGLKQPQFGDLGAMVQQQFQGLPQLGFGQFEDQAKRFYESELIPSLANRFTAMGAGRLSSNPNFAYAGASAAKDLATQLANLKSQYGLQQFGAQSQFGQNLANLGLQQYGQRAGLGSNLAQLGLQPQYGSVMFPGTSGLLGGIAGGLGQGLGGLAGLGVRAFTGGLF